MENKIYFDQWISVIWHKKTDKGIRYYEAYLHQDLWGGWVLSKAWGRRGTQLGRTVHQPYESLCDGMDELEAVRRKRIRRGYME